MTKRQREILALAAGLICLAVLCRIGVRTIRNPFLENLFNYIRILLYLGLFAGWGISVSRQIMQSQIRHYLIQTVCLMELWLILRELRWHLIPDPDIRRFFWYLYYIPILLIPLMAFFASMSLGRYENYKIPARAAFLYIPSLGLIGLVLSNDFHQLVFRFPSGQPGNADLAYSYGPAFYLVCLWVFGCALGAFLVMLARCRAGFSWLPSMPLVIAGIYTLAYTCRISFVVDYLGDLTVFLCLVITAFFECCIQCGLIGSSMHYFDLFKACESLSAQIADKDYIVRYRAADAVPIPREIMIRAEQAPVFLDDGISIHSMPIYGGHVLWSEDISELTGLRKELEDLQEDLNSQKDLVCLQYEYEKKKKTLDEQNQLYDLMQEKTQSQLDQMKVLAGLYKKTNDETQRKDILAEILILGSYIKRRKDFVLSEQTGSPISDDTLASAFGESYRSMQLMGIQGGYYVNTGSKSHADSPLTRAYDFFESCLESVLKTAKYLNVHVTSVGGALRMMTETDGKPDKDRLLAAWPGLQVLQEEEAALCILPLEQGGDSL